MQLVIAPNGTIRCLCDELIDLNRFGTLQIVRASTVEPNAAGEWLADLAPCRGSLLGPFPRRSAALAAEREWLEQNLLTSPQEFPIHGPSEIPPALAAVAPPGASPAAADCD